MTTTAITTTKGKTGTVYSSKLITPPGRLSYPHLFKRAESMDEGREGKFETTIFIPKTADIAKLLDAAEMVGAEAFGEKWKGLDKLKNAPVRDGDEMDDAFAKGCWVLRPKTGDRPDVVGPDLKNLEESDIYGGCWARLSIVAASYTTKGNWGVTFFLNNVQKVRDDERFGGSRAKASDDFEKFEEAAGQAEDNF